MELINLIQGKMIIIENLSITKKEDSIDLYMNFFCDSNVYFFVFSNVSNLNIRGLSFPMRIQGIEIIDRKSYGWENSSRYELIDYEGGELSFHFEKLNTKNQYI